MTLRSAIMCIHFARISRCTCLFLLLALNNTAVVDLLPYFAHLSCRYCLEFVDLLPLHTMAVHALLVLLLLQLEANVIYNKIYNILRGGLLLRRPPAEETVSCRGGLLLRRPPAEVETASCNLYIFYGI
jgi:hypothetical protein